MNKVYLTIDVDYWFAGADAALQARAFEDVVFLLKGIAAKPIFFLEHHHVLFHTNRLISEKKISKCKNGKTSLINVDFHSDLGGFTKDDNPYLNCGTWIDFSNKKRAFTDFEWYHPLDKKDLEKGYCHGNGSNPFIEDEDYIHNFEFVAKRKGLPKLSDTDKKNVVGVSIVLSKDYGGDLKTFNKLRKFYS